MQNQRSYVSGAFYQPCCLDGMQIDLTCDLALEDFKTLHVKQKMRFSIAYCVLGHADAPASSRLPLHQKHWR